MEAEATMGFLEDSRTHGIIVNIQKYSVHDGPGIRTIVFFKGCPLACAWCSNPETQSMRLQLGYNAGRCLSTATCTRCISACPKEAVSAATDNFPHICREMCGECTGMECAAACPSKGLFVYGRQCGVKDILDAVEQDAVFYARSSGGMTLSGGEPLCQPDFALALLREAKRRRIRTALETCGHVPWEILAQAAPLLSSILYDIKHVDPDCHKQGTGFACTLILANLRRLAEAFPQLSILARTPVIPGFNDNDEAAAAVGDFLADYPGIGHEALPYHRMGTQKYAFLDRPCPTRDAVLPDGAAERFARIVAERRSRRADMV
jgi:pyruvate formate lyase activating enzyme